MIKEFYENEIAGLGYDIASSTTSIRYPRLNYKLIDDAINQVY